MSKGYKYGKPSEYPLTKQHTQTHTPGPWKALEHDRNKPQGRVFCIHNEGYGEGETVIATLTANICWYIPIEANARLIASAPELLEVLKGCLRVVDAWYYDAARANDYVEVAAAQQEMDRIQKAIAKAEGKE